MSRAPIHLDVRNGAVRQELCTACQRTGRVAAAFTVLVSVVMCASIFRDRTDDLVTPTRIEQLKKQLASDSANGKLKDRIRAEDERLRVAHFDRRSFLLHGVWLMLGGAVVAAGCGKLAGALGATPYLPTGSPSAEPGWTPALRIGVVTAAVILLASLLVLRLPLLNGVGFDRPAVVPTVVPTAPQPPKVTTAAADWPGFRGPCGVGLASGQYPRQWDGAAGTNVLWKTRVPLPGHNSPIIAGDRVFLSGGDEQRREIYCFDAKIGSLQWTRPVGAAGTGGLQLSEDTGWAPSTMASDRARVFAIFPTGDLVCFDMEGQSVWAKSLGTPKNQYGHAASLLVWGEMLFVQFDQGMNAKQGLSALYAFDCATGRQRWKMNRPVPASWSTPAVVQGPAGPQLVALADPWVIAYEPDSGKEIWRAKALGGEIVPSPAFGDSVLYAAVDQVGLVAIKLDGRGDVTATHLRRIEVDAAPDIVSPVAVGGRVLLVSSAGSLTFVNGSTGKPIWSRDLDCGFHASPIAVGQVIYLTDLQGDTHVIEAGDTFKELARSPLGQPVAATVAFAQGKIFIRGKTDLFCIGTAAGGAGQ